MSKILTAARAINYPLTDTIYLEHALRVADSTKHAFEYCVSLEKAHLNKETIRDLKSALTKIVDGADPRIIDELVDVNESAKGYVFKMLTLMDIFGSEIKPQECLKIAANSL